MPGQLFVISAPSGAGKSTIITALMEKVEGMRYSVSHTTRKPRKKERDGVDYHFVDRATFLSMVDKGAFVEWATVYEDFYGTSFASLSSQKESGGDILLDLDTQGARNVRNHFEACVLIYILPPSLKVLEERLRGRGTDDAEVIEKRMEKTFQEIKNCVWYDYIVINDDLKRAIKEVKSIILSERCRTVLRAPLVEKLFGISFS